MKKKVDSIQRT